MNEELISVIVPVYNVENCIERCVESIILQSYKNIEILLIDDGSKDSSGYLCDELALKDDRLIVYHKENGGLGAARNYGIDRAKGVYICFVDSDDEIEPDYVKCLYSSLKQADADLSVCGYFYVANDVTEEYAFENSIISTDKMIEKFACGNAFFNFAWNKLYKKEIINQMPMHYSDRHCAEDMYFNAFYYRYCNKISIIEKPLYKYYVNIGSLSNGRRVGFWEDMLLIYDAMVETCELKKIPVEYANTLLMVMFRNSLSNFCNTKPTLKEFKEYIRSCISVKDITALKIRDNEISKVDKLINKALNANNFFLIYLFVYTIKWIKIKHFKIFCKIRKISSRG